MPDPLFSDLSRDTANLTWEPVEQVRRRGRQRTRRTRIAAGLASAVAVAVLASGAVALAGRPDAAPPPLPPATVVPTTPSPDPTVSPTPSEDPSATPSRAATSSPPTGGGPTSRTPSRAIPAGATLQLADLPPGFTMTRGKGKGDWTLESVTIYCENRSPSLAVGAVANRFVQFDSPTDWLVERVTRHSGSNADTVLQRVRRIATGCVPVRPGDSLSILAEGLGGDDSVLVAGEIGGIPKRWLFVRQGDLVAQLQLDYQATPADARRFAKLVADRLCVGTDAC